MRVSIEHKDKVAGLFRNIHQVDVVTSVQFTEEELAVIKSRKLKDYIVLERMPDSRMVEKLGADLPNYLDGFKLRIKDLMKGPDAFTCDTPIDAKAYEHSLTEALKELKAFIAGNAETATAKTFEL